MTLFAPLLFLLVGAVAPAAPARPPAPAPADRGMEVHLPDAQTAPAPNVRLVRFEYLLAPGGSADDVDFDALLRLQERLKAAAAATLAHAGAAFGVRVEYLLMPKLPAEFRMQFAQVPPSESARIKQFHDSAGALKDFHARNGKVLVLFEYAVSPRAPTPSRKAK